VACRARRRDRPLQLGLDRRRAVCARRGPLGLAPDDRHVARDGRGARHRVGSRGKLTAMSYARAGSLESLRTRARMLARIRAFFAERGVLEVETPALSPAGVSDLALDSVTATARSLGRTPLYLHTSPEYAMKRLLASGSGDIYQICRVFRDDELGRWHQPEFTLLEWYRVGFDDAQLMDEVEALLRDALADGGASWRCERTRYSDALGRALGVGAG